MSESPLSEKNVRRILLAAFCFSGAAALLYEVVWTRALSLVLGSTVYALSTMLATFMAGLALGAYIGGKIADRGKNLSLYFGLFELGIGLFGLITVPLIYGLPPFYFKMYKTLHLSPTLYFAAQFMLSAAIMLVPTTLMGATFPIVARRLTESMGEMGRRVGCAYSMNTVGAVFGSISAGFLLIPAIGIKWSSFGAGCLNLAVGSAVILILSRRQARLILPFLLSALLVFFVTKGADNDYPFANFYLADRFNDLGHMKEVEEKHTKLFEKDYPDGTVKAYQFNNYLLIQHGGKLEGTGPGDVVNTMMLALLPVSSHKETPRDMLVIGLGAGVTTLAASLVAENISVVEINPGVIEIVKKFGLPGTLDGVNIIRNDARKFLAVTDETYDIITSEPSVPTESVAANLFTKEFYEIAALRLNRHGIFCQGIQGWRLTKNDIRVCIKTFASVFEHVYVWKSKEYRNFTLVGSREPFDVSEEEMLLKLKAWNIIPPAHIDDYDLALILTPERVQKIADMPGIPLNTDDRPYLEFAMAKNFLLGWRYTDHR